MHYRMPKRKSKPNPSKVKRCRQCFVCGLLLFLFGWGFFRVETRIGSLAQQAAVAELNRTLNREIHSIVTELLNKESVNLHGLTQTQTDATGKVLSMSTDYQTVNHIKADLAIQVEEFLGRMDVVKATVPIGMLLSDSFMTGFGFPIPIRVFATNAIEVAVEDSFTSAGINQTRYKLEVIVTIPARVAGLFQHEDTCVTVQVPMEEVILVGEVPQTYLARGN